MKKSELTQLIKESLNEASKDSIAQKEFGMNYSQLGKNEKEWVDDEIDNIEYKKNKIVKEGLLNSFSDYETVFEMARHKAIPFAVVGFLLVKYGIKKAKELVGRGKEEVMNAIEDSPKQDLDTTPTKQRIKLFKKKDNSAFKKFLDNMDK
jgi:hypothetical protein